jgi:hypothetical protein
LVVVEKGKRKRVSTLEAIVRKQWAGAMAGDARAVRQIIKWSHDFLELPQSAEYEIKIVPNNYRNPKVKP